MNYEYLHGVRRSWHISFYGYFCFFSPHDNYNRSWPTPNKGNLIDSTQFRTISSLKIQKLQKNYSSRKVAWPSGFSQLGINTPQCTSARGVADINHTKPISYSPTSTRCFRGGSVRQIYANWPLNHREVVSVGLKRIGIKTWRRGIRNKLSLYFLASVSSLVSQQNSKSSRSVAKCQVNHHGLVLHYQNR